MRYEKPEMEVLLLKEESIIVTSLNGGEGEVSTETDTGGSTGVGGAVW